MEVNTANAQCTGLTAPFTENFDNLALTPPYTALPACWVPQTGPDYWDVTNDVTNTGHTWLPNIGDHTSGTSNYMWVDASGDITANEMVTPDIDVSGLTVPYVGFWFASNNITNTVNHTIALDVWDGAAWLNIATEIGNFPDWVEVTGVVPASIPAITKFRIYAIANPVSTASDYYYNDLGVDDFFVIEAPTCLKPTVLAVTNITSSSTDFGWTDPNGANLWEVEYGAPGYAVGTGTASMVSTNPTTISALSPATAYDIYVRAVCGAGDSSLWEGPISVTTACVNTLGGTYTIGGAGADYADITAAVTSLNTCGVNSAVTFNVAAGTYTDGLYISQIVGVNATNTVTFNGAGTATTTITHNGTGQYATIALDGADHITFQNFTIENTAISNGWGVQLTDRADYNTIDNCIINMDLGTSFSVVGILATGSSTSTTTTGNNANYTTISNTTINGGYYGIRFYGSSTAATDNTDNTINNCTINTYYYGIYFYYQDGPVATGNTVNLTNISSGYSLYCGYARHMNFSGNTLIGARTYALYIWQSNGTTQNATARATIANNMITALGSGDGIYVTTTSNFDIYYNSVTAENDQALWLTTSAVGYDVRNNIFVASGTSQVIDLDVNPTATDVIDFNIYYHSGGGDIAIMPSGSYATLAAWQAGDVTKNVNSLTGDPSFLSPTNLHLAGILADNTGTPIASITTDIDGDTRSAATPDIGADEYTAPSCAPPGALTAAALATTANLGWTLGSNETAWDVEYGIAGFTQGAGIIVATTTNPYAATGLTPNTDYEFYVRADCGSATSPWIGPFAFSTACVAFTAPFTEDFDGLALALPYTDLPNCWDAQVGPDFWDVTDELTNTGAYLPNLGDHTSGTGNYMWIDASGDILANEMVTPLIDISTLTIPYAGFWFASDNITNAINHTIALDVWDGSAWVNIATEVGNFTSWVKVGAAVPASIPSTTKFRIYAIAALGTTGSNYFQNDLGVDDFFVMEMPSCVAPSALMASNITATGATLGWTESGSATSWEVEYGVTGFTQGTGTAAVVTASPYAISGLTVETDYQFYVRAICAPGDTSPWSAGSFFTGYCTPAPTSVDGIGITNVTMGGINNTTGAETGNYGDYSTMVANATQGGTLPIDITLETGYDYDMWAWVDWNNDLDFTDAGEEVFLGTSAAANPTIFSASIAIPTAAALGNYRIRIGGADASLGTTSPSFPCYTGSYAAFEDYTLNVVLPCAVTSTSVITNANCFGDASGSIAITAAGGTAPYTYAWSDGQTTDIATGLVAAAYGVTITDANGCSLISGGSIGQPLAVATSSVITNASCFGDASGSIAITATGGIAPYTYVWSDGQTTATATGLVAAAYDVTVTDANGCSIVSGGAIGQPLAITLTATSVSDTSSAGIGTASVTAGGGTAPYTYAWSDGQTTDIATGLMMGTYTVTVTDVNGCTETETVTVDDFDFVSTTRIDYITNLSIYPNPTSNNAVIDLELSQNADVAVSIYTVTGVLVQDFGKENTSKATHIVDVTAYPAGMYLVRFVVDNQIVTKKLLVTK